MDKTKNSCCAFSIFQNRRQQINLPNMMCGVEQIMEDGVDHAVRLVTDVDGFSKVFFCDRLEGCEEAAPAFLPTFHHL